VSCYWSSWSKYRKLDGAFDIVDIDPTLCTNIIYSFVGLDPITSKVKSLDPWLDMGANGGHGFLEKASDLKRANPKLKLSLAVGGFAEGSLKYSQMANDWDKRRIFIESLIETVKKFNFDGVDLNWLYPGMSYQKCLQCECAEETHYTIKQIWKSTLSLQ
jgi:chitinase